MKLNKFEAWLMDNPIRRLIQLKVIIIDFLKFGKNIKGKKILEIGCGNGQGTVLINRYFKPAVIYGIDIDKQMISRAKAVAANNVRLEVGSAAELKFKNNSFDGIIDFSIVHHIAGWKKCLREINRVLKKGGTVFIEDMSIESFQSFLTEKLRKHLNHPYDSMYTKNQFIDYLEKTGLKAISKKSHNFLGVLKYFSVVAVKN